MPEYWDPGQLLQVEGYNTSGALRCLGRTRYNARCNWTIDNRDSDEARTLLSTMAHMAPSAVMATDLRRLAGLCLCNYYHQNQREETVARWMDVVKRAGEHYTNAAAQASEERDALVVKKNVYLDQLELALIESGAEFEDVQNRLMEAVDKNTKMRAENLGLLHEREGLKEALDAAEKNSSDLRTELETVQGDLARLSQENAVCRGEIAVLQGKLSEFQSSLESAEENSARLRTELGTSQENALTQKAENDRLRLEVSRLLEQLDTLQGALNAASENSNKLQTELSTALEKLHRSSSTNDQVRLDNSALEEKLRELQKILGSAEKRGDSLQFELKSTQDKLASADYENVKMNQDNAELLRRLRELEIVVQTAERQGEDVKRELAEVGGRLAESQTENDKLDTQNRDLRERVVALERKLDEADNERSHLETELQTAKAYEELAAQVPGLLEQISQLEGQIAATWLHRLMELVRRAKIKIKAIMKGGLKRRGKKAAREEEARREGSVV